MPPWRLARSGAFLQTRAVEPAWLVGRMPKAIYYDLRTRAEIEYHGPLNLPEGWTYCSRPIFDTDLGHPIQRNLFDEALHRYRPIMLEIAEQAAISPVVVTCALGKDRTGFVVAVILHMLGVSREIILEDYELSNRCLAAFRFDRPYSLVEASQCGAWLDFIRDNLRAPSATVARLRNILVPRHSLDCCASAESV